MSNSHGRDDTSLRRLATAGLIAVAAFVGGLYWETLRAIYDTNMALMKPPSEGGYTEEQKAAQRSDADIRSANAADALVLLTIWQIGFGVVGIYLVARTLRATQDAVREADEATAAARDAVAATREASYVASRPYLHSDQYEFQDANIDGDPTKYLQIKVTWQNRGHSPARRALVFLNFRSFPLSGPPADFDWPDPVGPYPPHTIGPGVSVHAAVMVPKTMIDDAWRGRAILLVWGRVQYGDGFDPDALWHSEDCRKISVGRLTDEKGQPSMVGIPELYPGPNGMDDEARHHKPRA